MIRLTVLITVISIAASQTSLAQQESEPDLYVQRFKFLEAFYQQAIEADTRYISGTVYQDVYPRTNGHQFFNSENWTRGTLVMMGRTYQGIPLKYDLYKDELVFNHIHESGSYALVLNKTRIDGFIIDGHTFTKLAETPGASSEIDQGFYEVVSEGKASFYQKWSKRFSEASQHSRREFSLFTEWYILNDGHYHRVTRKPGLLNALGDHEKELKSYIRESHIVIGGGDKMAIKKVIDYYNSLQ